MCGALTTYVVVKAPKASGCSGAGARRSAAHRCAARPRSIRTMAAAAGIVLAGGRSSRMGTPKAALEWHGSTLLPRIVGLVARGVDGPVVVVRAPGQQLPSLAQSVEIVEDAREGRGPLQGLAAGLSALSDRAEVAFVSSTDAPL